MSRLFVSGNYEGIIDSILQHLTGVDLTALQLAHPVLDDFIKVRRGGGRCGLSSQCLISQTNYWANSGRQAELRAHWDSWIPSRVRTEVGTGITCMAHQDLTLYCGLKSGAVLVVDQNILTRAVLQGHTREVTSLAVSAELLVSLGRDQQVITWSVRHRVQLSSVTSPALLLSVLLTPHLPHRVLLGSDSGQILVFLQLGQGGQGGHLVQERRVAAHSGAVTCLAAGPDIFLSASQDGSAKLWSLGQLGGEVEHVRDLKGHLSPVSSSHT